MAFWKHDIGAWSFLLGLLQNQINFNGNFQIVYSLFPQQSIKCNESPVIQIFFFKYWCITQTWSNYPFLASLGNPSEDNNCNFARGSPTELLLYSISFTNWRKQPKLFKGFPHVDFFGSIQNQSQILIMLQKNKALPEGGQRLNYKYDTEQERVLICRRTRYRTR